MSQLVVAIERTLAQLGVEVPRPLHDLAALQRTLTTAVAENPSSHLAEEVVAGAVTAKNVASKIEAVAQGVITAEYARRVAADLERPLAQRTRVVLAQLDDEIVRRLRPVFDAAVAQLEAAREQLGPTPDRGTVLAAGPLASSAWHRREEAAQTVEAVRRVMRDVRGTEAARSLDDAAWWIAPVGTTDELDRARDVFRSANAVSGLVDAGGFSLRLNTKDEAAAVVAGARLVPSPEEVQLTAAKERARAEGNRHADRWATALGSPANTPA